MLREWTRTDTARLLRVPSPLDDKYSRGVVALRTGSTEYPGAAVLGVEAAWRAGAGFVLYTGHAQDAVLRRRPETVAVAEIGRTRVDAWVIGSGTDPARRDDHERAALEAILCAPAAVVIDAGALDLAERGSAPRVLTPHVGEFARLCARLGLDRTDLTEEPERLRAAVQASRLLQATLLLKGSRTLVVAPDVEPVVIGESTPWLATAGTGDVLAGVVGALIAANPDLSLQCCAAAAAWLHARAAALAAGAVGGVPGHPIVALDVAEALPRAIGELLT